MVADAEKFLSIIEDFRKGQDILARVKLEIKEQENEIDPLLALRLYKEEHTEANSLALASALVLGKEVILSDAETGDEYLHFAYPGGDLASKFTKHVWLLDTFFSMCYGILLKKLTPPSSVLSKAEKDSIPASAE